MLTRTCFSFIAAVGRVDTEHLSKGWSIEDRKTKKGERKEKKNGDNINERNMMDVLYTSHIRVAVEIKESDEKCAKRLMDIQFAGRLL